jgi:threonyl-tRNA synthetase
MRVRHFTQDDAHIFCTPEQLQTECSSVIALVLDIYKQFGFDDVSIKLSTRPANRMGDDATWEHLEQSLIQSLDAMQLDYKLNPGEGAFYGPKLEFVLRDAIGRDWQCGTLQVDMNLPERFDISYVNDVGERQRPVMLHRALFGSLERFIGILLEHYSGKLPSWLAPIQAVVMSITEKIGYKIREHSLMRTPYLLIVGKEEMENGTVTLRNHAGENLGASLLADTVLLLRNLASMPQ